MIIRDHAFVVLTHTNASYSPASHAALGGAKLLNADEIERTARKSTACAIISVGRSQIVDSECGEMSEWLKEHAWK